MYGLGFEFTMFKAIIMTLSYCSQRCLLEPIQFISIGMVQIRHLYGFIFCSCS